MTPLILAVSLLINQALEDKPIFFAGTQLIADHNGKTVEGGDTKLLKIELVVANLGTDFNVETPDVLAAVVLPVTHNLGEPIAIPIEALEVLGLVALTPGQQYIFGARVADEADRWSTWVESNVKRYSPGAPAPLQSLRCIFK